MTDLISVVMPVYNAEQTVEHSIQSILKQSYGNFEFIIVNDGSTDNSLKLISEFRDDRILVIDNEKNSGIAHALNCGIEKAKGDFIARMDADDFAYPQRFEMQMKFLRKNSHIDAVGSSYYQIEKEGKKRLVKMHQTPDECNIYLLYRTPVNHPCLMARKEYYQEIKYPENYFAEDYAFFARIGQLGYKHSNLNEALLEYGDPGIRGRYREKQEKSHYQIIKEHFSHFGIELSLKQSEAWRKLNNSEFENLDFLECETALSLIWVKRHLLTIIDQKLLLQHLADAWWKLCKKAPKRKKMRFWLNFPLKNELRINQLQQLVILGFR